MSEHKDEKSQLEVASVIDEKAYYGSENPDDKIIEGSEGVTEGEFKSLRHVADTLPYTAWLVVVVEFAERWSYYGTANSYGNYIRAPLPPGSTTGAVPKADRMSGVAGALGQGVQKTSAIKTFNSFFLYVTPFLGGILADTKWGRYKTIMIFSAVCLIGHIILVISAAPQVIAKTNVSLGLLILAIFVIGVGAGGIKANVSPMVADQYTGKLRKETLPSGEVIIRSPAVTYQSIYLFFYAAINLGAAGAISAAFISRDHGYWISYLVPTGIFCLVPGILLLGKNSYVKTPPRGSVILETFRVIKLALGPAWSINPVKTYRNISVENFWDPAKPSTYGDNLPASITWDEEFVGEVSRTVKACQVFCFFPFFWLCYSQIDGNLGTMAAAMTLHGTPNDLIQNLNPISIIVMVPFFNYIVYPLLRRWKINFSPIKRIYAGFLVAGLAMLYAAILQKFLYETSPCHDNLPSECVTADKKPLQSPINVWVVSGPYILVGLAEIFASITSLEYAYTKAPQRMKSVVMAFSQFQTAVSSAINFALVPLNVEDKFTWLFGAFGIVSWIIGTLFMITFRALDKQEFALNAIGTGERAGFADEVEPEERKV
ncbi:peptide/h+ symporter protein [Cristinia sonorae]|uniref:Peptide/h+ symporter protein n=1 Tax=Cristinia sonorae TaxID=1940300 RepID=A0A8K0UT16_9AGAR|nr:peptide/h+ symporter protein [Cristinia sonorae]